MVKKRAKKVCVGVLFGGRSGEHEVSLASARSVMDNMDRSRYEVVPIGISKEGEWLVGGDPLAMLASGGASPVELGAGSTPATLLADPLRRGLWNIVPAVEGGAQDGQGSAVQGGDKPGALSAVRLAELDVVFPVLHGTYGQSHRQGHPERARPAGASLCGGQAQNVAACS